MAYKNRKKNKAHTQKINKDPGNWRNIKREKNNTRKAIQRLRDYGLSKDHAEDILRAQGLIK